MKSVRFSQVVAKSGPPEAHLLLTDPKEDRALQTAIKAKRVMTLMQATVGTKTDWGEAGFHPGAHRQYLIFPKSVGAYAGKAVIGIKYDLLSEDETEAPRSNRARQATQPAKKATPRSKPWQAPKPTPPASEEKPSAPEAPPAKAAKVKESPKVANPKHRAKKAPARAKPDKARKPSSHADIEPADAVKKEKQMQDTPAVAALKRQVKRAMQALEKGKQVAAFGLLQKIVDA